MWCVVESQYWLDLGVLGLEQGNEVRETHEEREGLLMSQQVHGG